MLGKHSEKTLHGAEEGAVYHIRPLFLAGRRDIAQIEPFWKVEVELYGGALPFTVKRILDLDVDLRPVKRPASFIHLTIKPLRLHRRIQRSSCGIPHFNIPDGLFLWPCRQIDLILVKTERA